MTSTLIRGGTLADGSGGAPIQADVRFVGDLITEVAPSLTPQPGEKLIDASGLAVEVRATASIYEARGEFQLNVETLRLAGIGALFERFERLKAQLAAAGWFAAEGKRPLPSFRCQVTLPRFGSLASRSWSPSRSMSTA